MRQRAATRTFESATAPGNMRNIDMAAAGLALPLATRLSCQLGLLALRVSILDCSSAIIAVLVLLVLLVAGALLHRVVRRAGACRVACAFCGKRSSHDRIGCRAGLLKRRKNGAILPPGPERGGKGRCEIGHGCATVDRRGAAYVGPSCRETAGWSFPWTSSSAITPDAPSHFQLTLIGTMM